MDDFEREIVEDDVWEICYECTGYGDDYYMDEDGELVRACTTCWVNLRGDWYEAD